MTTDSAVSVLVVDDDPFICDLVQETLSFHDILVLSANTGEQGLRLLQTSPVSVVLLDVHLGSGDDGFQVCRKIRDREHPPPVIFLSGLGGNEDVEAGYAAGACAYLTKPFSPLALIEKILAARALPT